MLPNRVLIREVRLCELLVHYGGAPPAILDIMPEQDRNLHGGEERRPDVQSKQDTDPLSADLHWKSHEPAAHERLIRKTHIADAGNRLQLHLQIPVKAGDFRIAVPCLPRVDLKQEQVLALK